MPGQHERALNRLRSRLSQERIVIPRFSRDQGAVEHLHSVKMTALARSPSIAGWLEVIETVSLLGPTVPVDVRESARVVAANSLELFLEVVGESRDILAIPVLIGYSSLRVPDVVRHEIVFRATRSRHLRAYWVARLVEQWRYSSVPDGAAVRGAAAALGETLEMEEDLESLLLYVEVLSECVRFRTQSGVVHPVVVELFERTVRWAAQGAKDYEGVAEAISARIPPDSAGVCAIAIFPYVAFHLRDEGGHKWVECFELLLEQVLRTNYGAVMIPDLSGYWILLGATALAILTHRPFAERWKRLLEEVIGTSRGWKFSYEVWYPNLQRARWLTTVGLVALLQAPKWGVTEQYDQLRAWIFDFLRKWHGELLGDQFGDIAGLTGHLGQAIGAMDAAERLERARVFADSIRDLVGLDAFVSAAVPALEADEAEELEDIRAARVAWHKALGDIDT